MSNQHVSGLLRELRRSADMSQSELAERAEKMNPSLISHFESGRRRPSRRHLRRLARALSVSADVFDSSPDGGKVLCQQYRALPADSKERVERIVKLFWDLDEERRDAPQCRHEAPKLLGTGNVEPDAVDSIPSREESLMEQYRQLRPDSQEFVERIVALFRDIAEEHEDAVRRRHEEWRHQRIAQLNPPPKQIGPGNSPPSEESED